MTPPDPIPVTARSFGRGAIELFHGDLGRVEADAIVNAANPQLLGGGGVDGALHRAAGPSLLAACKRLPAGPDGVRCPTGEVRVTPAGLLHARCVIHAVGPVFPAMDAASADRLLADVHDAACAAAQSRACHSIAFPAISTGAYGFPLDRAAPLAVARARRALEGAGTLVEIRFVLFNAPTVLAFRTALERLV